jgi:hypothetical protein
MGKFENVALADWGKGVILTYIYAPSEKLNAIREPSGAMPRICTL